MEEKFKDKKFQNHPKLKGVFMEGMDDSPIRPGINISKNLNN